MQATTARTSSRAASSDPYDSLCRGELVSQQQQAHERTAVSRVMTAVTGDYENKPFVCIPLLLDLRPDFDMWPPCFLREGSCQNVLVRNNFYLMTIYPLFSKLRLAKLSRGILATSQKSQKHDSSLEIEEIARCRITAA